MKKILLLALFVTASFLTAKAQYTMLLDFADTTGKLPLGSLISDGTFLYGMTSEGGTNDDGTIFKIKPDGTGYSKLFDFESFANGRLPKGSLIPIDTFLYGMTWTGGTNSNGIIFKIKPDGSGYSTLFNFDAFTNSADPAGSLIFDGTFLYGMTEQGGANFMGTVFKIQPNGTGYSKLLDFAGAANGRNPDGSLISDGTYLYGMTQQGGANNMGVIFKVKTDGTGDSVLLDFAGTNGSYPYGSLISDSTFLYGMTSGGGIDGAGVVFKIKPDGTGDSVLLEFTEANGSAPYGSLISDGSFLYGMTRQGGANGLGVLFKIKPDGTEYSDLLDFDGTNGFYPNGDLISDGTFLYGMTEYGGINGLGNVFKYQYAFPTSMAENNVATGFQVYPNPNSGLFTIKNEGQKAIDKLEIYNVLGEKMYSTTQQANSLIDFSHAPRGMYFMKIYEGGKIYSDKIVIH